MAPRAYWKGYLKLSLVSCPISLNPATSSSERVSFRQINKKTGNRLRQQMVDDETREPVESGDRAKGFEVSKNEYLLVEDEELEALEIESNHTIDIDKFVRQPRSTSGSTTAPITSCRPTRSGRRPSRSFAMP